MTDTSPLTLTVADRVATVHLNRPERFNAIDAAMAAALSDTFASLADAAEVRAVVLTGAGRAFCSGGDLRAMTEEAPEAPGRTFYAVAGLFHEAIRAMRALDAPIIAAINGVAAGGGFSLALACDLRLIAESARMKFAYTSAGLTPDGGCSHLLPRIVGLAEATRLALFDPFLSAEEALELGLVHGVVEDDDLQREATAWATRLCQMPTGTMGRTRRLFCRAFESSLPAQLDAERREISASADSAEGREGVSAFLEKRKAQFDL